MLNGRHDTITRQNEMYMKQCLLFYLLLLVSQVAAFAQYFPGRNWETRQPADLRMDAALVDSAVRYALSHEVNMDYDLRVANMKAYAREPGYSIAGPMKPRGKPAGLILKNGYIIAQWGDLQRVDMTFSVTKSYLSTVAGLASDAGLIASTDDLLGNYVWDGTFDGAHNSRITWKHLLQQTSDWSGCHFGICDWADRPPKEGGIDDWKNRKLLEPGTSYEYNDVRVNVLAYALTQVWRKPLPVVLKEKIMDPVGASATWRWYGYDNAFINIDGTMVQSVSGGGHFGGGLFINTLDQARFGLLMARGGKWNKQQLVSEAWLAQATAPSAANKSYGYLWWTNQEKELGNVSPGVFAAIGFGGNYIVIDRANDLVIVTRWLQDNAIGTLVELVTKSIR